MTFAGVIFVAAMVSVLLIPLLSVLGALDDDDDDDANPSCS